MLENRSISESDVLRPLIRAIVQEILAEVRPGDPPKLFSIEQAAEILGVPRKWIYERTAAGTIQHRKLGKYIRFTEAELKQISQGFVRNLLDVDCKILKINNLNSIIRLSTRG
jgi:excisionase family DNA binding protein